MKQIRINATPLSAQKHKTANSTFAQQQGTKAFTGSLKITAGLALLICVGLIVSVATSNLETIDRLLGSVRPWLLSWRILVFLVLIGGWRQWSVIYTQWAGMNEAQLVRMLDCRWRIAIWLLVMEAVLSQGVLSEFVNNLVAVETKQ